MTSLIRSSLKIYKVELEWEFNNVKPQNRKENGIKTLLDFELEDFDDFWTSIQSINFEKF